MLRYRRPLRRFQKFTVRTRVFGCDEKWFYLNQALLDGEVIAHRALVKFCCKGRAGIMAPEQVLQSAKSSFVISHELPDAVLKWKSAEAMI